MQYNKYNIEKINDKKIMRKVKKQWVVLSVSAFAALGASAFWMLNPDEMSVHADKISDTTQSVSKSSNNTSVGRPIQTSNLKTGTSIKLSLNANDENNASTSNLKDNNSKATGSTQSKDNNSEATGSTQSKDNNSGTTGATQSKNNLNSGQNNNNATTNLSDKKIVQPKPVNENTKAQNDWDSNQQDSNDNNSDYKNTYGNSTKGFTDAMNNDKKNIVQSQNNNTQTNPNPQNQNSGYQNGVNQYDQYRSAMNSGAADAYNGTAANTSSQDSTQAKGYYTAAYNGSSDAKKAYNNATQNEGTDTKSYTSYNQWLADNNKDRTDTPNNNKANAKAYQQNIDNNLDNSNNTSVKSNDNNIQVTNSGDLKQSSNQKAYQVNNKYPEGSAYTLAYQYGYNYFLANQGAADAKSGKWNGNNHSIDGSGGTRYNPSSTSNNLYDQSYLGAQAAINKQVDNTQNATNGVSINNYSGTGNTAVYQSAYNDVANSTQNGTVYLANSAQMDNVLKNSMSQVKSVKLINDIGYSDTNDSVGYPQINARNVNQLLDIDGQNHILDMTNNSYTMLPTNANTTINIHNFKTLYGSNYFGPFALNNSGANMNNNATSLINYSNVNYVGSKLLSAYYSNAYINGNVNVDAADSYNSPFNSNIKSQTDNYYGDGNYQENLQVNSMILGANANYFGNASNSSQSGSTVIQLFNPNSTLTLGKNSTMTLVPTGATSGENSPDNNDAYGINMSGTNPTLNVNEGASLNIFPNTDYGKHVSGIYNTGTINVNGGKINSEVNNDFASGNNQLINTQGQVNVTDGGLINVKVSGLKSGSSGLIQNSNNINVSNLGNLNVQDLDSSSNPSVNLISGNPVNIYNVGNKGVTLITNGNPASKFSTGGINAYTVVVSTDPTNKNATAYYNFNMDSNGDAQTVDASGNSKPLTVTGNTLYINSVPSVSFVGPVSTDSSNGVTTIHGYAKISKYSPNAGNLYVQYAYGDNSNYNELKKFDGQNINNTYSSADGNKYYVEIPNSDTNTNDLIPLNFKVPNNINASSYGIRLRYGVSGVNAIVTDNNGNKSYTANTEGYKTTGNGNKLQETDVQSASGDLTSSSNGSNDGLVDFQNDSSDKRDPARYQKDLEYTNAYDSAQSGYKYYMENSNDPSHQESPTIPLIPKNVSNPAAFRDGYTTAAQDLHRGYEESLNHNNINGIPSNNDNSGVKYGFAQGQLVLQGISDANNNSKQGNDYSSHAVQNTAYRAAVKAITDGMNGEPMSPDDLSKNPQVYQDAYNIAYQAANELSKQIASGNVDPNKLNPAQQTAYKNSQQALEKATDAAKNPSADNDKQYSGTDNASRAYQAAKSAYANGGTGSMTADQQNNPIYSKAFQAAQKAAQDAAKTGANQYINGQPNKSTEDSAAEQAANAYGYQQAQAGYNDAKATPSQVDNDKYNNDPSYKAGVDMNTDVNKGTNDANNSSNKSADYSNSHDAAQTSGYNGTFDGSQAGMNGDGKPADFDKQPQAYQDAYNKAYDDAKQKAQQIAQAIAKGKPVDTSKLTPAQKQAYQAAQKAIDDAESAAADNNPTNNDGKYNGTDNASRAYQAAKAGYANGGTETMTPNQQNDPIYSKAFNDAQQAARTAASNGAKNYVNGSSTNTPNEQTAAERSADDYGYQQAQKGYTAAKIDKVNNKNQDPSYQAGIQMNKDVNSGISDADNANTKDNSYANNHNTAQTSGYNGTFDGIQAGMNGNNKPVDLDKQPQAYQDAYNKAYDDAKQKAQQINQAIAKGNPVDTNQLTPAQKQAYQAAQKAIDNAESAAADNNPTNNDGKYNGTDNASRAYKAAQLAYANGGTGSMTPDQQKDPVYSRAFQAAQKAAQAAANNGAQNYVDGNNNNPSEQTPAEKAADAYGYQQAQKGYEAAKAGKTSNASKDPSYQAGIQMAKDVAKGTQAADQTATTDDNYDGTGSNIEKAAYQATKDAYQAAMNGTGKPSDYKNKSQAYRDAYDNAYNDANHQIDAINKGTITKNQLVPAQKAAYDQAQKALDSAVDDAKNNPDTINNKYNGTDNASRAYQAAKAGYGNAGNDSMDPKYDNDPVYKNAFNKAKSAAQAQAAQAVKDFADGKGDRNLNGNNALGKAYTQGYNEMQAGYNGNPSSAGNNDPSYQAGIQMAKDVNAGTTDAYNNPKQDGSYQGSLAKQEAYQATVDANKAASSEVPMRNDLKGQPKAYQDAYNKAYNHAAQMTKAAAAGNIDKNNLNNQLDRDSYNQGINASQQGYQAAQANDAKNNSKYSGQSISDLAYQGAQAGFNNGAKGSGSPVNNDPVYMNAYKNASAAARKYAKSGAQDFAQGTFKNSGASDPDENADSNQNDALNQAHNYGYQQAQAGYNAQKKSQADLSKSGNPEYDVGAKMARDSRMGAQFALNGTGNSKDNSDIAQRDGYQATISGYQDGANGHKQSLDGHSKAYQDAYNQAYENGQKLAEQGAAGKKDDIGLLQNNIPGQKAYAKGISDANNGYQAAVSQNGVNDDGKHGDENNNTDKAYQGALAGFKDGGNGLNQPTNNDPVYVKAYSDANQVAQAAIQAGVAEFAHGDDSSSTSENNDPVSMAHNKGFVQAKQGYQAQLNGKVDLDNNNPGYVAGVNMAKQYQKAIDDTNNNPSQGNDNNPISQATRAATLAGYTDSIHNVNAKVTVPNQYKDQNKVYQDAYNRAHQLGIDNAKAGAQAFNNNDVAPTGNDIASMAKEQGFAAARDAYNKAKENSSVPQSNDGSNYSETYNGAADAFNNALNGKYDTPSSNSAVYNSAYDKAMNEAKHLISEAAMNNVKNQSGSGSSNLSTDTISKLSDLGMNDASQAYQAAQANSSAYNSKDPNAINIYNGAKAAFDDIDSGHANASRNGNDLYDASYDKALQEAQSYAQQGADAYSNGKSITDVIDGLVNPTASDKLAIENGYKQAKAGHDDSMNGIHTAQQNNPYYNNEFNNAKNAVNDGSHDAMNDANQGDKHHGSNNLDQAYNGTVDAYKDAGQKPRDIGHMPPSYQDAYNQAKAAAQKAYEDGANQFNGDQPNDQINNPGAASIAHNNGYQAAQSIYNQILKDPNSVDSRTLNPAQKVGYDKAQQSIAGLKDYASGKQPTNTDSNYMSGYNTAKQAVQAAMNDAKNGKPAQTSKVPSGMNPQLYQDIYNATYSGYNNGYNGNVGKSNQGVAYNIAYKNAYQQGQYDVPVTPTPQPSNDNARQQNQYNIPMAPIAKPNTNAVNTNTVHRANRNSNKENNNIANVDHNTNQGILDALNGHKMHFGSNNTYKAGYNLGKEVLKGMRAAENGRKVKRNINSAKDSFYILGYDGYKAGMRAAKRTIKANKRLSKHDLVGKSQAYIYTFKQGLKAERRHQHNLGTKQGIAMAKKDRAMPARLTMTHSAQYVESYIKAYKRMMKRNMPKYIYNIRTIFVHKQLRFSKGNRIVRYVKMPRYKAKLLRVTGIAYYKNGIPRYRVVGGGMIADKRGTGIVADNDNIVNAYYRHNFKYFKVIKPKGTLTYKGMKFTKDNASHKVYHGEIFKVDKVVKYHGLTRFYLGHGKYITSNKTIVQKVG